METLAVDDFLAHYGVKGMKWGVRRSDEQLAAASAKKQKKIDKLSAKRDASAKVVKEIDDELNAMSPGIKKAYMTYAFSGTRNAAAKDVKRLEKDIEAVEKGKLTSTQKKLLLGAAVVGGITAYAVYNANVQSGNVNALKLQGKAFLEGSDSLFKKNPKLSKYNTPDDVLKHVAKSVNPNYKDPGGQMNCRRCTMTYELRRRGFDVQATTSALGWGQSESGLINAMANTGRNKYGVSSLSSMVTTKGVRAQIAGDTRKNTAETFKTTGKFEDVRAALSKQPVGARGEAVFNQGKFGHSLAWEKFADGIYLFDTQKGVRYKADDEESFSEFSQKWGITKEVDFTRLDNVELDSKFLARWATNKKG